MHHILNTYRPHQARDILRVILQTQIEKRKKVVSEIRKQIVSVKEQIQDQKERRIDNLTLTLLIADGICDEDAADDGAGQRGEGQEAGDSAAGIGTEPASEEGTQYIKAQMACVVYVAVGHSCALEAAVKRHSLGTPSLWTMPLGLLPVHSQPHLDSLHRHCYSLLPSATELYLVTDPVNFKHYEKWAFANNVDSDRIIIAPDSGVSAFKEAISILSDRIPPSTKTIFIDTTLLAPTNPQISSTLSTILTSALPLVKLTKSSQIPILCYFPEFSLASTLDFSVDTFGIQQGKWSLCEFVLEEYLEFAKDSENVEQGVVEERAYARVGVLGNPSDGFFGKTLGLLISNFYASVTLVPNNSKSPAIQIIPNSLTDPIQFPTLASSQKILSKNGIYGAERLIVAALKTFVQHCTENKITLKEHGFSVFYQTSIPRQVGLAGSSAIIIAFMRALIKYHGITHTQIPKPILANIALDAEKKELGIQAGLQDRVVQVYGGLVLMDFEKSIMEKHGHGNYQQIEMRVLPEFMFLAYIAHVKESGKMHVPVRQRWEDGDPIIHEGMNLIASLPLKALEINSTGASDDEETKEIKFANLVAQNFATRRKMYSDAALGGLNITIVEIMRKWGFSGKFCGSGGCVLGVWNGKVDEEVDFGGVEGEGWRERRQRMYGECKRELQLSGAVVCVVKPQSVVE
ncbi:hypothetical protein HK098_006131 [Nowakowskiella sp. JEL0407]|nr:hypothetical protein HK098_006131 [Nowakowskiella sp. JEL0407]